MQEEELSPHVDEIMEAVGDEASREQVLEELKRYIGVFRLDIQMAKRTIVKRFGGASDAFPAAGRKKIENIGPGEMSVSLVGKIVSVNEKEIESGGAKKRIFYGLIGDETGVIPYTAWETDNLVLERRSVVSIRNAYTTEYQGRVQLNLGSRTGIKREDSTDISVEEMPAGGPATPIKIGEISSGTGRVEVTGRIISIEKKLIGGEKGPREIHTGMIADDSGRIRFTCWGDARLKEDDVVKISSATVRYWRGIPQLNFDDRAEIVRIKGAFPSSEELSKSEIVDIWELIDGSGAADVTVSGTILQIKEGSGLIFRCPECKRVLQKSSCRIHGKVEGIADLRIKAVLDDGTGALTAVMNRQITEELLEMSIDECLERAREVMDYDIVRDLLSEKLIAKPVRVTGNVAVDEYGPMMIALQAQPLELDVRERAEKVLIRLEESE